jgi:hypothetical protein
VILALDSRLSASFRKNRKRDVGLGNVALSHQLGGFKAGPTPGCTGDIKTEPDIQEDSNAP